MQQQLCPNSDSVSCSTHVDWTGYLDRDDLKVAVTALLGFRPSKVPRQKLSVMCFGACCSGDYSSRLDRMLTRSCGSPRGGFRCWCSCLGVHARVILLLFITACGFFLATGLPPLIRCATVPIDKLSRLVTSSTLYLSSIMQRMSYLDADFHSAPGGPSVTMTKCPALIHQIASGVSPEGFPRPGRHEPDGLPNLFPVPCPPVPDYVVLRVVRGGANAGVRSSKGRILRSDCPGSLPW